MEEIQKIYTKNKKLVEEALEEVKMSFVMSNAMEERTGFMTLRLNGDVEPSGGMSMTSTPTSQKVKRGYDSISEGGGIGE